MDWQNIVMIILTVLLLGVWVPALILSVRRVLRKDKASVFRENTSRVLREDKTAMDLRETKN